MIFKSFSTVSAVAALLALSACASAVDTPNQQIYVQTPGATGARCVLATQNFRVVAYPPKPVLMHRLSVPLNVTCQAPGNREKTVIVHPKWNKTAATNVVTAGAGAVYDHFSGALYEYPSPIVVDFTHVRAGHQAMPAYHAPDTLSPFDQVNEDMMDRPAETPADQGFKTSAPKKAKAYSKEQAPATPVQIERPY